MQILRLDYVWAGLPTNAVGIYYKSFLSFLYRFQRRKLILFDANVVEGNRRKYFITFIFLHNSYPLPASQKLQKEMI